MKPRRVIGSSLVDPCRFAEARSELLLLSYLCLAKAKVYSVHPGRGDATVVDAGSSARGTLQRVPFSSPPRSSAFFQYVPSPLSSPHVPYIEANHKLIASLEGPLRIPSQPGFLKLPRILQCRDTFLSPRRAPPAFLSYSFSRHDRQTISANLFYDAYLLTKHKRAP